MSRQLAISDRVLTGIEGHAYGAARGAASAIDRLETREQIDARSDAHFERAQRIMLSLARSYPTLKADLALAVHDLHLGLKLDSLEDEHCTAALSDAAVAGSEARAIAGVCQEQLSAGGEGVHAA